MEIGKKWMSLNAQQKSVWEKKAMAEVNKTKIMNKGAVQRTIQAPIEVPMILIYIRYSLSTNYTVRSLSITSGNLSEPRVNR